MTSRTKLIFLRHSSYLYFFFLFPLFFFQLQFEKYQKPLNSVKQDWSRNVSEDSIGGKGKLFLNLIEHKSLEAPHQGLQILNDDFLSIHTNLPQSGSRLNKQNLTQTFVRGIRFRRDEPLLTRLLLRNSAFSLDSPHH